MTVITLDYSYRYSAACDSDCDDDRVFEFPSPFVAFADGDVALELELPSSHRDACSCWDAARCEIR